MNQGLRSGVCAPKRCALLPLESGGSGAGVGSGNWGAILLGREGSEGGLGGGVRGTHEGGPPGWRGVQ